MPRLLLRERLNRHYPAFSIVMSLLSARDSQASLLRSGLRNSVIGSPCWRHTGWAGVRPGAMAVSLAPDSVLIRTLCRRGMESRKQSNYGNWLKRLSASLSS